VSGTDAGLLDFAAGDILLLQLEVPVPAIAAVARKARLAGVHVLLNFAPFRKDAKPLLAEATHLIVNETELARLAAGFSAHEGGIEEQAAALAEESGAIVITTLGQDGVVAIENGNVIRAAALPVEAVDTVGAGDTFCGYF